MQDTSAQPELLMPLEGDTVDLYRAAIGPRGQERYLQQFFRFDAVGRSGPSWHWPACCLTLAWLAYRGLWRPALAYLAALLLIALGVLGVGRILLGYSDATALVLALLCLALVSVVMGVYAHAWFYEDCVTRISEALRATPDTQQACQRLANETSGARRWWAVALFHGVVVLLGLGPLLALLGPSAPDTTTPEPRPITTMGALPPAVPASAAPAPPVMQAPPVMPMPDPVPAPAPEPEAQAAAKPVPASEPLSRVTPVPRPAAGGGRWALQVGAFAQPANAQALRQRLSAVGLPLLDESPGRKLQRVRIGPLNSQAEIEQAEEQLRVLGLSAVLVRP